MEDTCCQYHENSDSKKVSARSLRSNSTSREKALQDGNGQVNWPEFVEWAEAAGFELSCLLFELGMNKLGTHIEMLHGGILSAL